MSKLVVYPVVNVQVFVHDILTIDPSQNGWGFSWKNFLLFYHIFATIHDVDAARQLVVGNLTTLQVVDITILAVCMVLAWMPVVPSVMFVNSPQP